MRNFVDLHTHSRASDGDCPPGQVVRLAERRRLAAVALTDHDTLVGLPPAAAAAAELKVQFVAGVEISARFPDGTLHLLGLGIDPGSRPLRDVLAGLREQRDRRNPRMISKLRRLGVDISMAELEQLADRPSDSEPVLGRLHMARILCAKGHTRSVQEAFDRYLAHGRPAFVDKERLAPDEAMAAIHAAGGVAVLAHPPQLNYANSAQLDRIVRSLVADGLDGLEVYHSDHTDFQTRACLDLARRLGLLVSGGSDFHGSAKPDARLGRPPVPLAAVEQLLATVAPD